MAGLGPKPTSATPTVKLQAEALFADSVVGCTPCSDCEYKLSINGARKSYI